MSLNRIVLLAAAVALGVVWSGVPDAPSPVSAHAARVFPLSPVSSSIPAAIQTPASPTGTPAQTQVASSPTASASPTPAQSATQTTEETDRPAVTSDPVDGYMALVPPVLRSGQTENISVSLFSGQQPARGTGRLAFLNQADTLAEATAIVEGTGTIPLPVPEVPKGYYQLKVEGTGFEETANVHVEPGVVLFVETDKPIYKPGQDMHIHVLLLDIELKPVSDDITVEVRDAKGTKVFREQVKSDEYGMASLIPIERN